MWIDCEFSLQRYVFHIWNFVDIDTFNPPVLLNVGGSSASNETYNMTSETIAWSSDSARFGKTSYTNDQVEPPPNWALQYPNGYSEEQPIPDLSTFYELQVWMRTAGLPTFSKLALRNPNEIMKAGTYQVDIGLSTLPVLKTLMMKISLSLCMVGQRPWCCLPVPLSVDRTISLELPIS